MNESKAIFIIENLKNIVTIYFDTFFVFYFFEVANYEVEPLAKYYLTLYLFVGIGFYIIRSAMKHNIKVPFFRIGISLQAIYVALIMLLKERMIDYIYLIGITKGIADGFFFFPKNILDSEKVTNANRQKYNGVLNIINEIVSIIVPLILGVALTYTSYTNVGKIFFIFFIIMFVLSFYMKDLEYNDKKFELKKFIKSLKKNEKVKKALTIPALSGFTYASGVMLTIVTIIKIKNFSNNLSLGIVDSIASFLLLITCLIFTYKIKKEQFKPLLIISGILSCASLIGLAFFNTLGMFITYFIVMHTFIGFINLISDHTVFNLSNSKYLAKENKAEYYLTRDVIFAITRCIGYLILLIVSLFAGNNSINYILILPGLSLLLESILLIKLLQE